MRQNYRQAQPQQRCNPPDALMLVFLILKYLESSLPLFRARQIRVLDIIQLSSLFSSLLSSLQIRVLNIIQLSSLFSSLLSSPQIRVLDIIQLNSKCHRKIVIVNSYRHRKSHDTHCNMGCHTFFFFSFTPNDLFHNCTLVN
jgi:hypothetical protein